MSLLKTFFFALIYNTLVLLKYVIIKNFFFALIYNTLVLLKYVIIKNFFVVDLFINKKIIIFEVLRETGKTKKK